MAWYKTGTAGFTNGTAAVVGVGTAWVVRGGLAPGEPVVERTTPPATGPSIFLAGGAFPEPSSSRNVR